MSFQGDVRGIGLAELLQGLARGRKEGILTLTSRGGHRSVIGLEEGKAHLLPDPDEDPEKWRCRARDAWAEDTRVDYLRMSEIARAQRLETLYDQLDGGDVHFRFEPGDIPRATPENGIEGTQKTQVFCDGVQVEFLLLEYARIADEFEGISDEAKERTLSVVPCVLDAAAVGGTPLAFLEQCDGRSTLLDIADRMGWPIRQARLTLAPALDAGGLRLAHASELLQLALEELRLRNVSRAAVRLYGWCRDGDPGPLSSDVAELLEREWAGGRLSPALRAMPGRERRTILRRMDHGLGNPSQSVVHWIEATRLDKTDRIARLKRMAAEVREGNDPDSPSVRDLLDWAKEQRDNNCPQRATPALVMAAMRQPSNTAMQLELGTGLVAAGRAAEGAPWVLAGSSSLLEQGHADRAVAPLRALLSADPRNRDCRQLLTRARRQSTQVRKLRKNLLLSLVITGTVAVGALVKVKVDADRDTQLDQVRQVLGNPQAALRLLDQHFAGDLAPEVLQLRDQIEERQRVDELAQRSTWLTIYHDAQLEASKGDPLAALSKIRAVPQPPRLMLVREPWPAPHDLLESIVDHLDTELTALGDPVEGSPQQVAREDQIYGWAETLIVTVKAAERKTPIDLTFVERLEGLEVKVDSRRDVREQKIELRLADENLERQDELYRKGEAYAASGDLLRALRCWEEVTSLDQTGKITALLEGRITQVRGQIEAVRRARELALEGRHEEAIALLGESLEDPTDVILPWKVASYPDGVRASQGENRIWTTPFVIETTVGELVELTFTADGYLPRTVTFDRPADRTVHLERSPDRSWFVAGRVDAIPVPFEGDHLVADRKGNLARIGADGQTLWTKRLKSLSGIARAPVFLPHRPGHLLMVTEDGDAWILRASDGDLEGPWQLGSTPMVGPAPSVGHVRVRLADGRLVLWSDNLKPVLEDSQPVGSDFGEDDGDYRFGAQGGFAVARRREGHDGNFDCPWIPWTVTVEEDAYLIHPEGQPAAGYSVLRSGAWAYLAWESPTARVPHGRLWVSDGAGVRAFVPVD